MLSNDPELNRIIKGILAFAVCGLIIITVVACNHDNTEYNNRSPNGIATIQIKEGEPLKQIESFGDVCIMLITEDEDKVLHVYQTNLTGLYTIELFNIYPEIE